MSENMVICPACGLKYTPDNSGSCARCPLHSGCAKDGVNNPKVTCCPNCGTETINPYASKWATWLKNRIGAKTT